MHRFLRIFKTFLKVQIALQCLSLNSFLPWLNLRGNKIHLGSRALMKSFTCLSNKLPEGSGVAQLRPPAVEGIRRASMKPYAFRHLANVLLEERLITRVSMPCSRSCGQDCMAADGLRSPASNLWSLGYTMASLTTRSTWHWTFCFWSGCMLFLVNIQFINFIFHVFPFGDATLLMWSNSMSHDISVSLQSLACVSLSLSLPLSHTLSLHLSLSLSPSLKTFLSLPIV